MAVKFITVEAPQKVSGKTVYIGVPQHERIYSTREAYDYAAEKTGYKATTISAAFKALAEVIRTVCGRGQVCGFTDVASFRNTVKGAFATSMGPWVKGVNMLNTVGAALDPFKSYLKGIIPTNNTEGAKPLISSVLDTVTGIYDVIKGTDLISIAGTDLGCDTTKTDEGVWLRSESGTETKLSVTSSSLQVVTAQLATALTAGDYTLIVRTRSGMGEEYGAAEAKRKVTVVAA